MKTALLTVIINMLCVAIHAQGTVAFQNYFPSAGVNAPVYESDGVTALFGPQFMVELLGGSSADNLASIATTGFLTGTGAGYFNGGTQSVPGVDRGNLAWVEVRAWNTVSGSSFLQAQTSGLPNSWWQSSIFSVIVGGGSANPTPPAPLIGLGNSPGYLNSVPEPSSLALAGLGMAAVVLGYKKASKAVSGAGVGSEQSFCKTARSTILGA